MRDAGLNLGISKNRCNGFGEALEPVDYRNENILHAAVLELVDHCQPEFGSFALLDPEAQHLLGKRSSEKSYCPRMCHLTGLSDAQIQLISVHESKKSLEIYQHHSLGVGELAYQEAVQGVSI